MQRKWSGNVARTIFSPRIQEETYPSYASEICTSSPIMLTATENPSITVESDLRPLTAVRTKAIAFSCVAPLIDGWHSSKKYLNAYSA